jgi:hypothetical protein
MKAETFLIYAVVLLLCAYICQTVILSVERTQKEDLAYAYEKLGLQLERFKMYYNETYGEAYNFKNDSLIAGIAFGDYITVWTEGKTITDVLEICAHEYAHNNLMMEDLK